MCTKKKTETLAITKVYFGEITDKESFYYKNMTKKMQMLALTTHFC